MEAERAGQYRKGVIWRYFLYENGTDLSLILVFYTEKQGIESCQSNRSDRFAPNHCRKETESVGINKRKSRNTPEIPRPILTQNPSPKEFF
jgi:hypothetical protein